MTTVAELETMLSEIDASIKRTLLAQSQNTGNANVTRATLAELRALRRDLQKELAVTAGTGGPAIAHGYSRRD